MATANGCIGMTGTNARPSVAPNHGVEGMFGTCLLYTSDGNPFPERFSCGVKLRSTAQPVPVEVTVSGETAELSFDTPQRVVANGQSAVFYEGDIVLGGGIIQDYR